MDDINILRRQMDSLKESLRESRIANRRLLVSVMKQKSSWLDKLVKSEFIITPIATLLFLAMCLMFDMSVWVALSFFVLSLADSLIDLKTVRIPSRYFGSNLIELRGILVRQKKQRLIQLAVELPLLIAWICWFIIEYCSHLGIYPDESATTPGSPLFNLIVTNLAIALVLGTLIIYYIYRRIERTNDAILSDIEELDTNE